MIRLDKLYYGFKLARVKEDISKNTGRLRLFLYEQFDFHRWSEVRNEQLRLMSKKSYLENKLSFTNN